MRSKLQDGDKCTHENGMIREVSNNANDLKSEFGDLLLIYYKEDLTRFSRGESYHDIIQVTRNNQIIWQRDEPIDINKMMTVVINGETYPLATHENIKILVDRISELELKINQIRSTH